MKKLARKSILLLTMVYCILLLPHSMATAIASNPVEVTVINQNNKTGTATILIKNVPHNTQQVLVPIWSQVNGQDDVIWYTATPSSDASTYKLDFDIKNHTFYAGTYDIHVYIKNATNTEIFGTANTMHFATSKPSQTVRQLAMDTGEFRIQTTTPVTSHGCKDVIYAVWSDARGQDDVHWYYAKYNQTTHSWYADINTKNYRNPGQYTVHTYIKSPRNQEYMYTSDTFQVSSEVSIGGVIPSFDAQSGNFKITLSNVKCPAGIQQLQIPVWSTDNQDNIIWYTANRTQAGTYVVDSSILKHKNKSGIYNIHIYATNNFGNFQLVANTSLKMTALPPMVTAQDTSKNQSTIQVSLANHQPDPSSTHITFAVWSVQNWQDDLIWYQGTPKDMLNTVASVNINNHKTAGTYCVHVYEYYKNSGPKLIGDTSFTIAYPDISQVKYSTSNLNTAAGTFDVTVSNVTAPAGVKSVLIPVWSAANQSDVHWYTAKMINSTTFQVTVDAKNHQFASGRYQIHGYACANNGLEFFLGGTAQNFDLTNYVRVSASANCNKTLLLTNVSSTVTSVLFPTWSNTNGQDDVVWYSGKKIGPNQWSVEIDLSNHKNYGNFTTHVYVGKNYANSINYSFSSTEFNSLKTGWRYENGYKFYYKNGVKQTDLDDILPPQSQYVIKVNRITCTVTVYAKDGANGYIIPVKVFACSVGLPSTPTPTGTFSTLAKYRWKELMGPSYGQYATRIVGGVLFHSVAGNNTTSYNISAYNFNKLGSPASHGCVRLTVRDAKWIYDHCKLKTTVNIFDNKLAGPFPKPTLPKIPSSQNWDPTDPAVKR